MVRRSGWLVLALAAACGCSGGRGDRAARPAGEPAAAPRTAVVAPETPAPSGTARPAPAGPSATAPGTTPPSGPAPGPADRAEITSPRPGTLVASPLVVTGSAPGPWYFEASFPVHLVDATGRTIASAPAQAQGEWMTTDRVPFRAEIAFESGGVLLGRVVAQRISMEDGRELDRVEVPVRLSAVRP